jgi:hypothetical protein
MSKIVQGTKTCLDSFFIYAAIGCATGLVNSKTVEILTNPRYGLDGVHSRIDGFDPASEDAKEQEIE